MDICLFELPRTYSIAMIEEKETISLESDVKVIGEGKKDSRNERPIIGVLAQEITPPLDELDPGKFKSYIAASYVKYLESAGARVVPIRIGQDREYYKNTLENINGVLFPGGATWFYLKDGYADAGEYIFNMAKKMNDEGDYFPLWGTCLGFELMLYLEFDKKDPRDDCKNFSQSLNLEFTEDFQSSKMFNKAPEDVVLILSEKQITYNYHRFCVTEKKFSDLKLCDSWRIMSLNSDQNGLVYVSSTEAKKYPFYGVQFHPEKCIFEWHTSKNIPHSEDAIRANRYFADFFVAETRKSNHRYTEKGDELNSLIYNYRVTYTGKQNNQYEQCYMFE